MKKIFVLLVLLLVLFSTGCSKDKKDFLSYIDLYSVAYFDESDVNNSSYEIAGEYNGYKYYYQKQTNGNFTNGGFAKFEDSNTFTISKPTPGDKVEFGYIANIESKNDKYYRIVIEVIDKTSQLSRVTSMKISGNSQDRNYYGVKKISSEWITINSKNNVVSVTFWYELNLDNSYQNQDVSYHIFIETSDEDITEKNNYPTVEFYA